MPPEVACIHPPKTPAVRSSSPMSPETQIYLPLIKKYYQATTKMKFTSKKFIVLLVIILSAMSFIRLLRIVLTTYYYSPLFSTFLPNLQHTCYYYSPTCTNVSVETDPITPLTKKEFKLLSNLITHRAPCKLLIFGFQPQYLSFTSINAGGTTIFLEDDPNKLGKVNISSNNTRMYKVEYSIPAKKAYGLLNHARKNPSCLPNSGQLLQVSKCRLALSSLPQEVYDTVWDVMLVDGPSGNSPEAPGRMGAIYTASLLARKGNETNVLVHDVDRMIEKWFSWEFLCDENLVSSKGKLWNFRIRGSLSSTRFCNSKRVKIE